MSEKPDIGPLVIGAIGGSGTTVLADTLTENGCFMFNDDPRFVAFAERHLNDVLRGARQSRAVESLQEVVNNARANVPAGYACWGWKEPRTVMMLDFLDREVPGLRFVHLIRDGRDMAWSRNQLEIHRHGPAVLEGRASWYQRAWIRLSSGLSPTSAWFRMKNVMAYGYDLPASLRDLMEVPIRGAVRRSGLADFVNRRQRSLGLMSQPVYSMMLWSAVNQEAADYGETQMQGRYLRIRYEDLVTDPAPWVGAILELCGIEPPDSLETGLHKVDSVGRYARYGDVDLDVVVAAGHDALQRFGYLSEAP